jgi:hypothetical protein
MAMNRLLSIVARLRAILNWSSRSRTVSSGTFARSCG